MTEPVNAFSAEQVNEALEKAKQMDTMVQGVANLVQQMRDITIQAAALIDCLKPQPATAPEMEAISAETAEPETETPAPGHDTVKEEIEALAQ